MSADLLLSLKVMLLFTFLKRPVKPLTEVIKYTTPTCLSQLLVVSGIFSGNACSVCARGCTYNACSVATDSCGPCRKIIHRCGV